MEPSQPAQLRTYYDGVIQVFGRGSKGDRALSFAARFNQFPRHVARDLQSFSDCPSLSDEPGEFVRSRKIHAFRQKLDVNMDGYLHRSEISIC